MNRSSIFFFSLEYSSIFPKRGSDIFTVPIEEIFILLSILSKIRTEERITGSGNAFAKFFKNERIKSGKSQIDASVKMKYASPQFVSNWERGVALPPVEDLKTLAKFIDVDANLLFEIYEKSVCTRERQILSDRFKEAGGCD